ncbi:MAG: metallophosphoesterase [Hyphomicrobiaceae bacterium]
MSSLKVIQFSDPHLARDRPYFLFNWSLVVGWINEARPDLVVCTGDMALNGVSIDDDLAYAREQFNRIEAPWLVVPGNHDVGNNRPDVRGEEVVTEARLDIYRKHFGPDHWRRDIGAWSFIGLNSLIVGSGFAAEEQQWSFLQAELDACRPRPIAIFLHKPPFLMRADESTLHQGCLYPEPRKRFLDMIEGSSVRLVSAGHNHELASKVYNGIDIAWCPATSFVIKRGYPEPRGGGRRIPGYLELSLSERDLTITPVLPKQMLVIDAGGWLVDGIELYQRYTTASGGEASE